MRSADLVRGPQTCTERQRKLRAAQSGKCDHALELHGVELFSLTNTEILEAYS